MVAAWIVHCLAAAAAVAVIASWGWARNRAKSWSATLDGRHVVVVGGSQGLGLEIAKVCVQKNAAHVTLVARRKDKLELAAREAAAIAETCGSDTGIHVFSGDASSSADCEKLAREAVVPADVLFLCAGGARPDHLHNLSAHDFDDMMRLNYFAAVNPILALLPSMRERRHGDVCIASSATALVGTFGYASYAPAKWALRGFAETVYHELVPYGIRVSQVFCPDMDTPGFRVENETKPEETHEISEGQMYSPAKVARVAVAGVMSGSLRMTVGFDLFLLRSMTAGFAPEVDFAEVALSSLLRIVSVFYHFKFASIVRKCKRKREHAALLS